MLRATSAPSTRRICLGFLVRLRLLTFRDDDTGGIHSLDLAIIDHDNNSPLVDDDDHTRIRAIQRGISWMELRMTFMIGQSSKVDHYDQIIYGRRCKSYKRVLRRSRIPSAIHLSQRGSVLP